MMAYARFEASTSGLSSEVTDLGRGTRPAIFVQARTADAIRLFNVQAAAAESDRGCVCFRPRPSLDTSGLS